MKFPGSLIGLALIIATVGAGPQAQGGTIIPPGYEALTYDVTLKSGVNGVSQILFINQQSTGELGGWTWPYSLGPGSSSIVEEWPTFAPFPPVAATFAIGLVSNLPGDPAGGTTTHLAVFGNFTAGEVGESFSTLFPHANESTLIYDLTNIFVIPPASNQTSVFESDVMPLFNDANNLGLFISPGGNLDVVAFTDGQLIGTGTFEVVSAPEPSSFLLLGSGILGLLGAVKLKGRL